MSLILEQDSEVMQLTAMLLNTPADVNYHPPHSSSERLMRWYLRGYPQFSKFVNMGAAPVWRPGRTDQLLECRAFERSYWPLPSGTIGLQFSLEGKLLCSFFQSVNRKRQT